MDVSVPALDNRCTPSFEPRGLYYLEKCLTRLPTADLDIATARLTDL
ncbi:hypothetical protein CC1G_14127 [Coprinopsis cinerea okayama7|uniref:Uncharacterized protein n=1 Tax=Coprinopsis cinerea (strain Okayama-7 / 130 / ATCC MYA-4618 / FGSC 9003) TaxID=240176 RepID=D6RLB2_COPC7|nr:hypothetical protein CC1G_14127 [Coprinopsis cinerea okayama7\|eukprot:XP_002911594.1 hypothetical protein CC1G_14127 [Coprinopsis cinerea okayama7\